MESANLESVLDVLGCDSLPTETVSATNLYSGFGASPVARLFATGNGFKLRFGSDVPMSAVDFLPSGGIRVKPILLPRAQRSA
jgi:hypothetical protein